MTRNKNKNPNIHLEPSTIFNSTKITFYIIAGSVTVVNKLI